MVTTTPIVCVCFLGLWCLGAATDGEKTKEKKEEEEAADGPVVLEDIPATRQFIKSDEVIVIGFFKDLTKKEVKDFHAVAKEIQNLQFGLTSNTEVLRKFNISINTITVFRKTDNERLDLEITEGRTVDSSHMSRFIRMNELHVVTEYNPVTAIGLFNSAVPNHLLLFVNKKSKDYQHVVEEFRAAAGSFMGKMLFVLVDTNVKNNERVLGYFQLQKKDTPAVGLYNTATDEKQLMPAGEISAERVKGFCHDYLQGKIEETKGNPKPEEKELRSEL
ncbi:endoplasmic reticulum resident protein 27 [Latimeria chalumnae]|uniref:endoplasmic reticulum resident protein 27 n=1 Tax=Latimeria chalumnae TaxID=7897 RepID=UPI00313AFB57